MSPCKYKDSFGKPGEGAHKYRLFGLAIVDVILTIVISLIIAWFWGKKFWMILLAFFILGEILHIFFCVKTPITNFLTQ